jgi:hypothetical protein
MAEAGPKGSFGDWQRKVAIHRSAIDRPSLPHPTRTRQLAAIRRPVCSSSGTARSAAIRDRFPSRRSCSAASTVSDWPATPPEIPPLVRNNHHGHSFGRDGIPHTTPRAKSAKWPRRFPGTESTVRGRSRAALPSRSHQRPGRGGVRGIVDFFLRTCDPIRRLSRSSRWAP